jgi:hypothetical protein
VVWSHAEAFANAASNSILLVPVIFRFLEADSSLLQLDDDNSSENGNVI